VTRHRTTRTEVPRRAGPHEINGESQPDLLSRWRGSEPGTVTLSHRRMADGARRLQDANDPCMTRTESERMNAREHRIEVVLSDGELEQLDELRGGVPRAVWLRQAIRKPPVVTDVATREEALGILTAMARDGKVTPAIELAKLLEGDDAPGLAVMIRLLRSIRSTSERRRERFRAHLLSDLLTLAALLDEPEVGVLLDHHLHIVCDVFRRDGKAVCSRPCLLPCSDERWNLAPQCSDALAPKPGLGQSALDPLRLSLVELSADRLVESEALLPRLDGRLGPIHCRSLSARWMRLRHFSRFCRDVLTTENGVPLVIEPFQRPHPVRLLRWCPRDSRGRWQEERQVEPCSARSRSSTCSRPSGRGRDRRGLAPIRRGSCCARSSATSAARRR
jgi:hypothetical protein